MTFVRDAACNTFTRGLACSDQEAASWKALGETMGFTDFKPETVNWNVPMYWRGFNSTAGCTADDQDPCIMPLGVGFAVVLGFGVFFTFFTILLSFLEQKVAGNSTREALTGSAIDSENFNTAGRNVKTGLTASVIVSQWTWAATLLQSSNKAWQLGISGPFWYAAGATIQVLLFGILAIEVKKKCPNAHTFLEIIDVRWGKVAHITFLYFAFMTNMLVTGQLLLGGGSVMQAASGMDQVLCCFLIPFGVVFYTVFGGLKATFMAGYIHTTLIMLGLVVFVSVVYLCEADVLGCVEGEQCNVIGSAGAMYERLAFIIKVKTTPEGPTATASHVGPVKTNRDGSYLTMMSGSGLMFGIINTVGNFGTVFVDQSYWQSAIAASPASAHKGYLLGGLVWFTIPFALATSLGLAGVALNGAITSDDANNGLVPPAAATMLLGKGGGVLTIIMLFMAITSTGSAECIAVSSLVVYDIYRKYINPKATGKQILFMSRIVCLFFGLGMGAIAAILSSFKVEPKGGPDAGDPKGISMGWIYVFMGNMIGSAVFPVAMSVMWKDCSALGAIAGAWSGLVGSIVVWIACAGGMFAPGSEAARIAGHFRGGVTYWTLFEDEPLLYGNLTAILLSALVCTVISWIKPQNYDWSQLNEKIKLVDEVKSNVPEWELSEEFLDTALAWSWKYGGLTSLFLCIVWPAFISMPWGVLPKGVYALWVSVAFTWGWLGTIAIVSLPIIENWGTIKNVLRGNFTEGATRAAPKASAETATA